MTIAKKNTGTETSSKKTNLELVEPIESVVENVEAKVSEVKEQVEAKVHQVQEKVEEMKEKVEAEAHQVQTSIQEQIRQFKEELFKHFDQLKALNGNDLVELKAFAKTELNTLVEDLAQLTQEIKQDVSEISLKHKDHLTQTLKRSKDNTLQVWSKTATKSEQPSAS